MYTGLAAINGKTQRFYVAASSGSEAEAHVRRAAALVHGTKAALEMIIDSVQPHRNIVWQGA